MSDQASDEPSEPTDRSDDRTDAGVGSAGEQPGRARRSLIPEGTSDAQLGEKPGRARRSLIPEGTSDTELGEISGGGEVTNLGGDAPSS